MTTETQLRSALQARAGQAPTVDPEQLLADLAGSAAPVRSTSGVHHGRRWAIAGVAAGVVALAGVPIAVVAAGAGGDARSTVGAGGPSPVASAVLTAPGAGTGASTPPYNPPLPSPTVGPVDPNLPGAWVPLAADWVVASLPDPAAVVVDGSDPIVATYTRPGQELTVLPSAATAKDSSDAQWVTAIQVYLPESGFDPTTMGAATPVSVNSIPRQFGTLDRLLTAAGPAQVPSLLWQVGDTWVVLQIDNPAVPTLDQLTAAAMRLGVYPR